MSVIKLVMPDYELFCYLSWCWLVMVELAKQHSLSDT